MASNDELVQGINANLQISQIKGISVRNGMATLHQDGMLKVREGLSSFEECIATVPTDMEDLAGLRENNESQPIEAVGR